MKALFFILVLNVFSLSLFAQTDFTGTWVTGNRGTIVEIEKSEDSYIGKISYSDDSEIKPGTQIMKDVKEKKGKWAGRMYAPKRDEWYDIEIKPLENKLEITVYKGFFSKTITWTKDQSTP